MPQAIIPGLPDDLALRCLAKVSHGYHGLLECVSMTWRDAIRSSDYSCLKAQEGWCGNWLFVLTEDQHDIQWNAYDPEADRWHPLPRIPGVDSGHCYSGFACVTVHKRFLVIGGYVSCDPLSQLIGLSATNDVIQFDPFKKQWSRVASMRMARAYFACAAVGGKVYLCGGRNSSSNSGLAHAEVYDPFEDRWEDLPPLPDPHSYCFGLSVRGRFYVTRELEDQSFGHTAKVFDPVDMTWHNLSHFWPFSRLTVLMTTVGDCIVAINEGDGDDIEVKESDEGPLLHLGSVPSVLLPDHSRPLKAFTVGMVGLGQDLYLVGGKALRWGHCQNFEIVKLDKVRVCNLAASPLEWREARPMRGSCGSIMGCASLEESEFGSY